MPRPIIDTASSRGRLVRRRLFIAVLIVAVLLVLALAWAFRHGGHPVSQGNLPPRWNLGLREDAA